MPIPTTSDEVRALLTARGDDIRKHAAVFGVNTPLAGLVAQIGIELADFLDADMTSWIDTADADDCGHTEVEHLLNAASQVVVTNLADINSLIRSMVLADLISTLDPDGWQESMDRVNTADPTTLLPAVNHRAVEPGATPDGTDHLSPMHTLLQVTITADPKTNLGGCEVNIAEHLIAAQAASYLRQVADVIDSGADTAFITFGGPS